MKMLQNNGPKIDNQMLPISNLLLGTTATMLISYSKFIVFLLWSH